MENAKRLIIIGNGFDLHCGLHSSFSDFFETWERPKIEKWIKSKTIENLKETSLISLLLYNTFYRENYVFQDWSFKIHDVHYNDVWQNFKQQRQR